MAEGPQAKLRAAWLQQHLAGAGALSVEVLRPELEDLGQELEGGCVERVFAAGKQVWFELADGRWLYHHLRFDGRWRQLGAREAPPPRAWLVLAAGDTRVVNLGGEVFELLTAEAAQERRGKLGPDVLAQPFPEEDLSAALRSSRRPVADLILDQAVLCGAGNRMKSEALHAAGLDPRLPGDSLEEREARRLARALRQSGEASLALGGRWGPSVYESDGQPCPRCAAPIQRLGRTRASFWCPRCQGGRAPVDPARQGRLFRGLALWGHPGWSGVLFPPGTAQPRRLAHTARRVTAVEGNTLFYGLPERATVERWAEDMPAGFRFLPKLPREITHEGLLLPQLERVPVVLDRLAPLAERLGPAFAQLPSHYGPERRADLFAFLEAWPHERLPLTLELRHPGWFEGPAREDLVQALVRCGVGRVVLDTRAVHGPGASRSESAACSKPLLPLDLAPTAEATVVRFIGSADPARNRPLLEAWAARVDRLLRTGRDVYWFAHCPNEDRSPEVLLDFERRLAARGAPAEPLPWDGAPARAPQGELF